MMNPALLADVIVAIHVLWVLIVILTVPLVWIGVLRGWQWVRNWWLRHIHLGMIGIVVAESYLGIPCPLTVWEKQARQAAKIENYEGSFIGNALHELIFFDFPPWVFTVAYSLFGLLVVFTYIKVPPRKQKH